MGIPDYIACIHRGRLNNITCAGLGLKLGLGLGLGLGVLLNSYVAGHERSSTGLANGISYLIIDCVSKCITEGCYSAYHFLSYVSFIFSKYILVQYNAVIIIIRYLFVIWYDNYVLTYTISW